MQKPLKNAAEIVGCALLVLVFAYIAAVLVLSLERVAPQVSKASSSPSESAQQPAAPALSHPIPYSATVKQDGRTRYYVRSDQ